MKIGKKTGLYLNAKTMLGNPGYLEVLQEKLGLNLVILSFTGELPPEVLAYSPFDGFPPSEERLYALTSLHLDGRPTAHRLDTAKRCIGPHIPAGGNDQELKEAIARIHRLGIDVWLLAGAYTSSDYDMVMFCPSKAENNRWYEALYCHLASAYGVEGLDITHARYIMTSQLRGLFACMCDSCAQAAAELGYDMPRMTADIYASGEALKRLEGKQIAGLAELSMGGLDFYQLLGAKPGLIQWFNFRVDLLARNLKHLREAVHKAGGEGFIFGADTYPASLSMFAGHNQTRWAEFSDFASPLISHADIFPMKTLVSWAEFLRGRAPSLSEAQALRAIYRLVGYDGLKMPASIAEFALGEPDCEYRNIPLRELLALDVAKARLYLPKEIESYPIIQGGGAPHLWPRELIEAIMADVYRLGHNGLMFQGTKSLVDFPLVG